MAIMTLIILIPLSYLPLIWSNTDNLKTANNLKMKPIAHDLKPSKHPTSNITKPQPNDTQTSNEHSPNTYKPKKSKASTNLTNDKPNATKEP
uniref:F-ORF n=1 Tax=Cumberlandia monodonta TaxID=52365 RepID=F4ZFE6_CUMMO|nr:F-ORF [Cumberlandia monodonta]AEC14029.1 female-specific orf protein [Cumberlandia monodonta]AEC14030.1 female-specific orf protein [Cumberlandia monodonta]AEC14032.1 female-specific orf protein [Cumberlandia monodonta]AEC14033.1 female-specific orf protein [Cumberlandia monodonta]AEC14034.1 female-specific orf protein [Cumberlandia monodonta]